jgi:hypothetical protein
VERVLNARTGDGDTHAIEIGNDDEQGHQPQHAIAVFHGLSSADLALLYQPMQGTVYQSNSRGVRPGPCWQGSSASLDRSKEVGQCAARWPGAGISTDGSPMHSSSLVYLPKAGSVTANAVASGERFPSGWPLIFLAHFSHTGRRATSANSGSEGWGWLMPDQHSGARTAGDHHYRIKHLPLE